MSGNYGNCAYDKKDGLYRARDGMIMGVCKGLAQHLGMNVTLARLLTFFVFLFTGIWPVVICYLIAGIIMKPEPVVPFESIDDQEFYNSYTNSRQMALHRLKHTYDAINRRLQRMEDIVTAKDYDWDSRLRETEKGA